MCMNVSDNETELQSVQSSSISSTLGSNLKQDLLQSGIDNNNTEIIVDNAISLSSSLAAAFAAFVEPSFKAVSEKFIEGASIGISKTSLTEEQKISAASTNSYATIRTIKDLEIPLSTQETQEAIESISTVAAAKLQQTGISTTKFSEAIDKISSQTIKGIENSGIEEAEYGDVIEKAVSGITKGITDLSLPESDTNTLFSSAASSSINSIKNFTESSSLLSRITSGITKKIVSIQETNEDFDHEDALSAINQTISSTAQEQLSLDNTQITDLFTAVNQTIDFPSPKPIAKSGDVELEKEVSISLGDSIGILVRLETPSPVDIICYSISGIKPSCELVSGSFVCTEEGIEFDTYVVIQESLKLKSVSCTQGKRRSSVSRYIFSIINNGDGD